jgi:hypothetical protein
MLAYLAQIVQNIGAVEHAGERMEDLVPNAAMCASNMMPSP